MCRARNMYFSVHLQNKKESSTPPLRCQPLGFRNHIFTVQYMFPFQENAKKYSYMWKCVRTLFAGRLTYVHIVEKNIQQKYLPGFRNNRRNQSHSICSLVKKMRRNVCEIVYTHWQNVRLVFIVLKSQKPVRNRIFRKYIGFFGNIRSQNMPVSLIIICKVYKYII